MVYTDIFRLMFFLHKNCTTGVTVTKYCRDLEWVICQDCENQVTVYDHEDLPGFHGTELCDEGEKHPGFKTCEGMYGVGPFTRTVPGRDPSRDPEY